MWVPNDGQVTPWGSRDNTEEPQTKGREWGRPRGKEGRPGLGSWWVSMGKPSREAVTQAEEEGQGRPVREGRERMTLR